MAAVRHRRRRHAWLAVGGGARASGHILGREMQDDCHNAQSFRCYDLDYDHGCVTVVAAASATMPWYPLPNAGFEAEVDGVATSWPELYGDAAGRAVLRSLVDDARLWIGARQRAQSGNAQSRTARAVASFERGTWIEFGASWHMWTLCGGIHASDGMARSR